MSEKDEDVKKYKLDPGWYGSVDHVQACNSSAHAWVVGHVPTWGHARGH